MIVNSSINSNFNVISGQCIESVEIDDVSFHIEDMYFISTRVEIL